MLVASALASDADVLPLARNWGGGDAVTLGGRPVILEPENMVSMTTDRVGLLKDPCRRKTEDSKVD